MFFGKATCTCYPVLSSSTYRCHDSHAPHICNARLIVIQPEELDMSQHIQPKVLDMSQHNKYAAHD